MSLRVCTICIVRRWMEPNEHGTSHISIVDEERNAVSMTTTINDPFGALLVSPFTGIILNDEMGDFSISTNSSALPAAPANRIAPGKRPLSSMSPTIVLDQVALCAALTQTG